MFQRILVPLDGSEYAEAALPMAARIAQAGKGTVVLLHVLSGPREFLPYILPVMLPSTLTADVDAASAYLAAVSERPDLADVTTITEVRSGLVASTILDVAADQQADLVVLAAHAHTGLARWAPGNIVEHVVDRVGQHGAAPVLTLTDANAQPNASQPAHGIVLLDGAEESEAAILPAVELLVALSDAQQASATLRLVWIGEFEQQDQAHPATQTNVSAYLRALEERLSGTPGGPALTVTSEVIVEENLSQVVADLADEKQATFIALASHGKRNLPLDTSADFDVRLRGATSRPLLLVAEHAAAEAGATEAK